MPALAFLEASAGLGLIVSGVFLLSVATILYTSDSTSLPNILVLAYMGALLGDHSGFFVGKVFGPKVWQIGWIKGRKAAKEKAQIYLRKSAPLALCLGRFVPFMRSLTPIVAGVSGMSWPKFLICDLLACSIWVVGLYLILINVSKIGG